MMASQSDCTMRFTYLALVCAFVLVGHSSGLALARPLEEPAQLPPVVATEQAEASQPAGDAQTPQPRSEATPASHQPAGRPDESAPKRELTPGAPDETDKGQSAAAHNEQAGQSSGASKPAQPNPSVSEAPASDKAQEKDIKSLLENKNDAENDLASAPDRHNGEPNPAKPAQADEAPPVIASNESEKASSDNDRFHYSLGAAGDGNKSPETNDKQDGTAPAPTSNRGEESAETEKAHDESKPAEEPATGTSTSTAKPLEEPASEKKAEGERGADSGQSGTPSA